MKVNIRLEPYSLENTEGRIRYYVDSDYNQNDFANRRQKWLEAGDILESISSEVTLI